ncbi:hypothetical protein DdX_09928 [Ditylenchus destructor]|uniref:Uncharacterized protein n=1 Tax=Ditylenchus destructor TaxID=166010 RepID=A0AAD4N3S4_9BILA|nr:hypothetical protein DdX_09928 [Ditylenchus destructor]
MANTNETESMDDIRELMMKKSLEWNITIAKAKIAAYDEKIKQSELQLSHEKSQNELVEMLADQSLRTLEVLQSNCLTFHSTVAQNEMCISSLRSLCEDNLQCIDTTYNEVESLATRFGNSIYQNAPWLVEKDQLTAEHDKRCEELGWLHQQNKAGLKDCIEKKTNRISFEADVQAILPRNCLVQAQRRNIEIVTL